MHRGPLEKRGNKKSSQASCTPACDGQKVYVNFLHKGSVVTSALDLDGGIAWQTTVTGYQTHQGFSSSPCLFGSLVIVSADNRGGGAVVAMSRATGKVAWNSHAPRRPTTPPRSCSRSRTRPGPDGRHQPGLLVRSADRQEVVGDQRSHDRMRDLGRHRRHTDLHQRWLSEEPRPGRARRRFRKNRLAEHATCLRPVDDRPPGHPLRRTRCRIATAWDTATGKTLWKKRLGGTFTSSLVLAAGNLYATDESGQTSVFAASRDGLKLKAKNKLGQQTYSSMAISGGRIFHRVATNDGGRREWLYCLSR
ncbi:MAG: hypothetical protein Ct9H300mP1_16340 [Planctomycetaceae bacterium]|nr:MAG: hypothetical protein Ct9H300mP1_16340 [Planctomycetaceae bacterium]